MAVVYKINREDGLSYIGITTNFKTRLRTHTKSIRFSIFPICSWEILFEGEYHECEYKEEYFISLYDTYKNGLNETPDGKGKSKTTKFNTLGKHYSKESKEKMSKNNWLKNLPADKRPSRKGIPVSMTQKKHEDCIRRKNKDTNPSCRLKTFEVTQIQLSFSKFTITKDIAIKYCKKTQIPLIEGNIIVDYEQECVTKGGQKFSKKRIFAREICTHYKCSATWIEKLLDVKV